MAVNFHTCGRWDDRYDMVCDENVDMIHCDRVDLESFKAEYADRVVIVGNVNTIQTLLQGTAAQVREETIDCLKKGAPGGRYIVSADCATPRDTDPANIAAMAEAVEQYADYPLRF
jgi:uroporphyrinogen decarboxylase